MAGDFGAVLAGVTRADLRCPRFGDEVRARWLQHRGLVVLRGQELAALSARDLVTFASRLGSLGAWLCGP